MSFGKTNYDPSFTIKPPANFSGDINGITIKLVAHDTDTDTAKSDSSTVGTTDLTNKTIYDTQDTVTLNLHVNPMAGDITAGNAETFEDTAVKVFRIRSHHG